MITVFVDNKEIPVNYVKFSDGAITYKLDGLPINPKSINVNVCPSTPVNEVREELGMIVSCIQQCYKSSTLKGLRFPINLDIPYMPYGRADRLFEEGNPTAPLYGFLSWLEDLNFNQVTICDLHNETVIAQYGLNKNMFTIKTQLDCYKDSLPQGFNTKYDYVIAPDKGAVYKAKTIANYLGVDIIFAGKTRNISTGRIEGFTLPDDADLSGKKVLIPDDICDGAGTFVGLSEEIKNRGAVQVDLYVTHLIASKGLKMLTPAIDNVYCYQIIVNYINKQDVMNFNLGNFNKIKE